MAHTRSTSELNKTPHSVSLKVLRLSKPHLSYQYPLPRKTTKDIVDIDPRAALSYPTDDVDDAFILSPLVTLPSSFGVLHVGESFACTLCVNNELPETVHDGSVSGVHVTAMMQTPSQAQGIPLDLTGPTEVDEDGVTLARGETFSRIARFDLREEGTHILQATVTYNEASRSSDGSSTSEGRTRTFRKLYQFVAQQLLSVRTKAQFVPSQKDTDDDQSSPEHVLEAQIENVGDVEVVLEDVQLLPKPYFVAHGMNLWDVTNPQDGMHEKLHLRPGEVQQVCFLVTEADGERDREHSVTRDGRTILGQLSMNWRGPMGESGSLSTGWLSTRKR